MPSPKYDLGRSTCPSSDERMTLIDREKSEEQRVTLLDNEDGDAEEDLIEQQVDKLFT